MSSIVKNASSLYLKFGPKKEIGVPAKNTKQPHYYLLRKFKRDVDLLVILNTKRCKYQCHFCQLPMKSSRDWIPYEDIAAQFNFVLEEVKNSLAILDRITISNEGSVFDQDTMPIRILMEIARVAEYLPSVNNLVLETRLEFVTKEIMNKMAVIPGQKLKMNILTGFETISPKIRDEILVKREPLEIFLKGLDVLAEGGAELTSYVLFKPSPYMSDNEAYDEANRTIYFLREECDKREINLTVRLNPMYKAQGSKWAQKANSFSEYHPPKLTDVIKLAHQHIEDGLEMYIGLSNESLSSDYGDFSNREDYSKNLVRQVILFNSGKIASPAIAV